MADSAAVYRSQQRHCPIEEDEVETKPEKLMDWASVLLSHSVQKAAKQFFSADAWECVHSTLTILEGEYNAISAFLKHVDYLTSMFLLVLLCN